MKKEECKLRVSDNRVLRRRSEPNRKELAGDSTGLQDG